MYKPSGEVVKAQGRNQLANAFNPYQSDRKRVLCVCSAGLLRSTTIAYYLTTTFGYNVRNCGTTLEYALVPISEALLAWADEIHVVEEQRAYVEVALEKIGLDRKIFSLDIPDQYPAFDEELLEIIHNFYGSEYTP